MYGSVPHAALLVGGVQVAVLETWTTMTTRVQDVSCVVRVVCWGVTFDERAVCC